MEHARENTAMTLLSPGERILPEQERQKKGQAQVEGAIELIERDRPFLQERLARVNAREEMSEDDVYEKEMILGLLQKLDREEAFKPTA